MYTIFRVINGCNREAGHLHTLEFIPACSLASVLFLKVELKNQPLSVCEKREETLSVRCVMRAEIFFQRSLARGRIKVSDADAIFHAALQ